jgi:hypothetical protein
LLLSTGILIRAFAKLHVSLAVREAREEKRREEKVGRW